MGDDRIIKIALVGNPNTGKSLIFSRMTGIGVISSNYPGTTVTIKIGKFKYQGTEYEVHDLPGIYSLDSFSSAEDTALRRIADCDILINVIDATTLERNLNLTLQLLSQGKPLLVCLNFWDDTKHKGITIDRTALETLLGVPVVATSALSGEGINTLVSSIQLARPGLTQSSAAEPWNKIGQIVNQVQKLTHRHHTFLENLADFTLHPIGGLVAACIILSLTFIIVRYLGEGLVNGICEPLFSQFYYPLIQAWVKVIPVDFITDILIGHTVDPLGSFGILSTGVYIALVLVFPYFISFYLMFGLLEDSGYLPRLAVILDSFLHRFGLHGYSSIPIMLGLGCKVPAFLATRVLVNRREKILTTALILMSAPCLPQSAMIFSLGVHYGTTVVIVIFALLFLLALGINAILNKLIPGQTSELFMEIPPYRFPSIKLMSRKLWIRIIDYIREIFPMIAAGVLIIHILYSLKVIDFISDMLNRPISALLGLPHDIAPIMILGFLRKDVSIALLAPFNLSGTQFIIASIFMVLYIPCIASFFTLIKELGIGSTLKITGLVFISAIAITSALHGLFLLLHWAGIPV